MYHMRKIAILLSFTFIGFFVTAQESIDPVIISKIKDEGLNRSKVMEIAFHLTDVSGPRLTVSPGFTRAANWAKNQLSQWGLSNAQLEPWGDFGKGWEQTRCYIAMTAPYYHPLIAIPRAWTGGTPGNGIITGELVLVKAKDTTEALAYAGKLKDKIVMLWSPDTLRPSFEPDAVRFTPDELKMMADKGIGDLPPPPPKPGDPPRRSFGNQFAIQRKIGEMIAKEKPLMMLGMSRVGSDGTLFVMSGGSYGKDAPEPVASLVLSGDDFLQLQRLAESGIPVTLETDVKTKFFTDDTKGYNVIAEIPGTDPKLKSEIVMVGGHLDSWHGATGATDNAAGCAVMMEAVRILKTMGVKPRRTIRIALWSGEEQGLYGSRNYVKNHFADPGTMELKPEHEQISAYYNLDNGSGRIRGIYTEGNKLIAPIFKTWLEPFTDMDAATVTTGSTGGTDHMAFNQVGIPGFQFIQDALEYDTRTHHSNMDTYDHLVPADLKQASVIVAAFLYQTAQRDEKMPRKDLPKPTGGRRM
jgi:carboxypeptidase Q